MSLLTCAALALTLTACEGRNDADKAGANDAADKAGQAADETKKTADDAPENPPPAEDDPGGG
jgi:hypothetical protein